MQNLTFGLNLSYLGALHLGRMPAHTVRDALGPVVLGTLADLQAASKKDRRQKSQSAPLAGLMRQARTRGETVARKAVFDCVKAEETRRRQAAARSSGLKAAGLKDSHFGLQDGDFIDPLTLVAGEGADVDLRAERALALLNSTPMELDRVYEGEQIRTRAQEQADEAKQFAHNDWELLSDDLRQEIVEQEGIVIPWDANVQTARGLADAISDPALFARVESALERADSMDDHQRVYLTGGLPAFRQKKALPAGRWQPYTPTLEASPFAGVSLAEPEEDAPRKARPVATALTGTPMRPSTHARLSAQLAYLQGERRDEIATYLGSALEDGDLRESAAYDEARNQMMDNEARIRALEDQLARAIVTDDAPAIDSMFVVRIGGQRHFVKLVDANPAIGQVSIATPFGQALAAAKRGDTLTIAQEQQTATRKMTRLVAGMHALSDTSGRCYRSKQPVPLTKNAVTTRTTQVQVLAIWSPR